MLVSSLFGSRILLACRHERFRGILDASSIFSDGTMTEPLDPEISEDLLKGRSKELDGESPQTIQSRLSRAREDLDEAIREAKEALASSPATPLFEEKLAEDASVASAKIEVTPEGNLVVIYSVAEDLSEEGGDQPAQKQVKKRSSKQRKKRKKDSPEALLRELEAMLENSTSGYRGLPLPRMREIADLLGCDIDQYGRKKIKIHEELLAAVKGSGSEASADPLPETTEDEEVEVSDVEEGSSDPEVEEAAPELSKETDSEGEDDLDFDDIDFDGLFDDEDEDEEPASSKKRMKTGDPQPVTVVKSPLSKLHEEAAKREDFRS